MYLLVHVASSDFASNINLSGDNGFQKATIFH